MQSPNFNLEDPNFYGNKIGPTATFDHNFIENCNDRAMFLIQTNEYQDAIEMLIKCE